MDIKLSKNSAISVKPFGSYEELAKELTPALTSGSVGLSGGSTYTALFKEWAKLPLDLSNNWYCAVDERVVPFEDEDSNWGIAARELFTPLGVPEQNHNHYTTPGYLRTLMRNRFDTEPYIFDTIFLGVGDDGHTASIFPDTPAMSDVNNVALETVSPKGVAERVTMAPKVITNAKNVIAVIAGEGKEQCIEWLAQKDMTKPFVAILSKCDNVELYLETKLYDKLATLK